MYDNDVDGDFVFNYDLSACLEYNGQSFGTADIKKILAVIEGVRDEYNWSWIIELKNGKFVYMTGGCDYTGWDCQSWANSTIYNTEADAINAAPLHLVAKLTSQLVTTPNKTNNQLVGKALKEKYPTHNGYWD